MIIQLRLINAFISYLLQKTILISSRIKVINQEQQKKFDKLFHTMDYFRIYYN